MNKDLLKKMVIDLLKEEMYGSREEVPVEEPADAEIGGMSASDMRSELLAIAKDSRMLSAVAGPEREIIIATLRQLMELGVQKNITSGNVATLLNKLFTLQEQEK